MLTYIYLSHLHTFIELKNMFCKYVRMCINMIDTHNLFTHNIFIRIKINLPVKWISPLNAETLSLIDTKFERHYLYAISHTALGVNSRITCYVTDLYSYELLITNYQKAMSLLFGRAFHT